MTKLLAVAGYNPVPLSPYPYAFPVDPPYNVPIYAITPTPDGTGRALHPDVVVFAAPWHGYRYWMAVTPYPPDDREENPTILCSHDGYQWFYPPGLTNPIDPWPGQAINAVSWYNSDTDMIYDPDTDELVAIWREVKTDNYERIWMSHSPDGTNWAPKVQILQIDGTTEDQCPSPSIIRVDENDWRLYAVRSTGLDRMWSSTSRDGPFADPVDMHFTYAGAEFAVYHGDVIYNGGRWYAILHKTAGTGDHPATSSDGINWTVGPQIIASRSGKWDANVYRPCLFPDPGGGFMHVWYSTLSGTFSCRVGYTRLPMWWWPEP